MVKLEATTAQTVRVAKTSHRARVLAEQSGRHTLRVRYGETDQMGVVYHANYVVWFHEARDALLLKADIDVARLERDGYRFPVVDIACRYLRPARYGDEVVIDVRMLFDAVARMHCHFEVRNTKTGRLLANGSSLSVVTDHYGKVKLRLPKALVSRLVATMNASPHKDICREDVE